MFHNRTVPSMPMLARCLPSGLNATGNTELPVARSCRGFQRAAVGDRGQSVLAEVIQPVFRPPPGVGWPYPIRLVNWFMSK